MSSSKDKDTDLTGTVTTELKKIPDYGSLSGSNKNKAQIPKGIDLTTTTTNNVSLRVGPTSIGNKAKGII